MTSEQLTARSKRLEKRHPNPRIQRGIRLMDPIRATLAQHLRGHLKRLDVIPSWLLENFFYDWIVPALEVERFEFGTAPHFDELLEHIRDSPDAADAIRIIQSYVENNE